MAVTGTADLVQSLKEVVDVTYDLAVPLNYVYAQPPITQVPAGGVLAPGSRWSSLAIPFYSPLVPANTARSEIADIAAVALEDSEVTITPSLYGNAVQLSLALQKRATPDVMRVASQLISENAGKSIDFLARTAAVGGRGVTYGIGSSRDAVTSAGQITDLLLNTAAAYLSGAPRLAGGGRGLAAIMRNVVVTDLAETASIILVGQNRDVIEPILLGEVGQMISGVRIIESEHAKVFHGAGASLAMTTENISAAAAAGQTTLGINTVGASDVGAYPTLGTRESTANGENARVETIFVSSGAGTSAYGIVGGGPNGGLVYSYSSGTALDSFTQVHAVVVCGADAIMKVYASDIGPDGEVLPWDNDGLLGQFDSLSWRWFGGFGIKAQNRVYRLDVGAARPVLGI